MTETVDNDQYHKKAKRLVAHNFNEDFPIDTHTTPAEEKDFYVVWFAKVLGNWKALVSTDLVNDGQYWEVTHNGAKQETYVDHYYKKSNRAYGDDGYNRRFPNG